MPANEAEVPSKTTSDTKVRRAVGEYLLRHQGDVYIWLTAHAVFAKGTNAADIRKAHEQILDYARSMIVEEGLSKIEYVPVSALAEVWEKAIAIARTVEEDDLRPTDGMIGAQVVREGLEAARDAALSVQKENKDEG